MSIQSWSAITNFYLLANKLMQEPLHSTQTPIESFSLHHFIVITLAETYYHNLHKPKYRQFLKCL
jgi:hypothetical protein